ncbi:MAG: hypothetical protein ACKO3F_15535 [Cyanobium sp.]
MAPPAAPARAPRPVLPAIAPAAVPTTAPLAVLRTTPGPCHWHLGRLGARSRAALDWSRGIESGLLDGPQPALQVVAALLIRTLAT